MKEVESKTAVPAGQPPLDETSKNPKSSVTREKLVHFIAKTRASLEAAERVLAVVNQHPDIDADMALAFGITPVGR